MNVNCKISLTDADRNRLAQLIDGKQTKRLATRKDVNEFITGCIEYACSSAGSPAQPGNDAYMRGWDLVGERLRTKSLR
jgi:hypothetical protein